jgi:hypothetical protein
MVRKAGVERVRPGGLSALAFGVFFQDNLLRELFTRADIAAVKTMNHEDFVIVFDRPAVFGADERYGFSVLKIE